MKQGKYLVVGGKFVHESQARRRKAAILVVYIMATIVMMFCLVMVGALG